MQFASAISDIVNANEAIEQACAQIVEQLKRAPCDFACVFVSAIYRTEWEVLLERIHDRLSPRVLMGCSGSGIIGAGKELEWVPGVSIVAGHLPTVRLYPFIVTPDEMENSSPGGFWIDKIGAPPAENLIFVTCVDPYTCDPPKLVSELNSTYPKCPMVGGLVSGGNEPGEHLIFMGKRVLREGAVGVGMSGDITMDTLISQGARPIGRPYVVTEAEDDAIIRVGNRPVLEVLHEALSTLSMQERELAQQGAVLVGLAVDEMRAKFLSGDFVIRNIVGIDPDSGALAISDEVQVGQTLQFHLRDASASRDELRRLLAKQSQTLSTNPPAGALIFNCMGRGRAFYGSSHHDVKTIHTFNGKLPLGGFFCNGEIGPVGGTNVLHGYTASLGFFRPVNAVRKSAKLKGSGGLA